MKNSSTANQTAIRLDDIPPFSIRVCFVISPHLQGILIDGIVDFLQNLKGQIHHVLLLTAAFSLVFLQYGLDWGSVPPFPDMAKNPCACLLNVESLICRRTQIIYVSISPWTPPHVSPWYVHYILYFWTDPFDSHDIPIFFPVNQHQIPLPEELHEKIPWNH